MTHRPIPTDDKLVTHLYLHLQEHDANIRNSLSRFSVQLEWRRVHGAASEYFVQWGTLEEYETFMAELGTRHRELAAIQPVGPYR